MTDSQSPSVVLATFAAGLRFEHIPEHVLRRTEDLFLDWFGSALAGRNARAVQSLAHFAATMGPATAPAGNAAEVLITRGRSTPMFAAMVNAAASHIAEQD